MVPGAASTLCAELLDGPVRRLHVVHRSPTACQLADAGGRVVLCLVGAGAIRLPHAAVVPCPLPEPESVVTAGDGVVGWSGWQVRIARWWIPARPRVEMLLPFVSDGVVDQLAAGWGAALGRGDGLTPYQDDVLCGALVLLRAAGHPRAGELADHVVRTELEAATTATSAALLRLASEGWCIDELAGYLGSLGAAADSSFYDDAPIRAARTQLLAVGHSSGRGLLDGVHRLLPRLSPEQRCAA